MDDGLFGSGKVMVIGVAVFGLVPLKNGSVSVESEFLALVEGVERAAEAKKMSGFCHFREGICLYKKI